MERATYGHQTTNSTLIEIPHIGNDFHLMRLKLVINIGGIEIERNVLRTLETRACLRYRIESPGKTMDLQFVMFRH